MLDLFNWMLLSWLFLKYLNAEPSKWLLWFVVIVGLGLLKKYWGITFLIGMMPGLLFSRNPACYFGSKTIYGFRTGHYTGFHQCTLAGQASISFIQSLRLIGHHLLISPGDLLILRRALEISIQLE